MIPKSVLIHSWGREILGTNVLSARSQGEVKCYINQT